MRSVVYARYSTDLQRDASIEDQIRLCRERIGQEGWQYLHAYTDRASSGATALRPGHQAMLEDARRGEFRNRRSRGTGPAVSRPGGRRWPL
jgi:DNA invertase Pin-like site-specific DNA recombinase